jgi:hypothetical protein
MYSFAYNVADGGKVRVLAVKELTSERNVERCSDEWDSVVMDGLEWHSWSQGEHLDYGDVPVCEGTFSFY